MIEVGTLVRFTRARALRWGREPRVRVVAGVRVRNGEREVTFDGVLWGPAKHFEVVDDGPNRVEASIAADRATRGIEA